MTSAPSVPYRRFAHIDALRAVAVMLVVLQHNGLRSFVPGGSGVTIFFAISGFIITYLMLREHDRTGGFAIGRFYLRRVLKLGPPLVVVVLVPSVVYGLVHGLDWAAFASQALFSYNWVEAFGSGRDVLPGSGVVWSLAIEEQFYIVFAALWLLVARRPGHLRLLGGAAAVAVVYATVARLVLTDPPGFSDRIYYGSDTRLDGLAWGILAALLLHAWAQGRDVLPRLRRLLGHDAALLGAILLFVGSLAIRDDWFRDTFRYTAHTLAAVIVILYGFEAGDSRVARTFRRVTAWRWVQWIGLASYSIYLAHLTVLTPLRSLLIALPPPVAIVTAIGIGVGAGLLLYRFLEMPFERLRRRLHHEDARAVETPAAVRAPQ